MRRVINEHSAIFNGTKAQAMLLALVGTVVETRSVNQWKRVKPQSASPPPLYGASLTAVDKRLLYLFGGNDDTRRFNDLWLFDIGTSSPIYCRAVKVDPRLS